MIPAGVFSRLFALEELHLEVNVNLYYVPVNAFLGLGNVRRLNMLGSPSSCSRFSTSSPIQCECAQGFSGDGSYCAPVDCASNFPGLNPLASPKCQAGNTKYNPLVNQTTGCNVTCNAGYAGGPELFNCTAFGYWNGSIGCTPVDCKNNFEANLDALNAQATCSGNTAYGGDPCLVDCKPGFGQGGKKRPPVPYTCGANGKWQGSISCSTLRCEFAIDDLDPNALAFCLDTSFGAKCRATCRSGYTGDGGSGVDFVCGNEGRWVGSLTCSSVQCGRSIPTLPANAEAKCRGDTSYRGDDCVARCKPGFSGGVTTYECSSAGFWFTRQPLTCTGWPEREETRRKRKKKERGGRKKSRGEKKERQHQAESTSCYCYCYCYCTFFPRIWSSPCPPIITTTTATTTTTTTTTI